MNNEKATYDSMTHLRDWPTFFNDVKNYEKEGQHAHIVLIQLARLKNINRKYGVRTGDKLLEMIGKYLSEVHPGYMAYRLLNGRFMMLGKECSMEEAERLVHALQQRFQEIWYVGHEDETYKIQIKALLMHFYAEPEDTENDLLEKMNYGISMLFSNEKEDILFFDDEIRRSMEYQQYVMNEIRYAIDEKTFQMYYQPIYDCEKKEFVSAESLIRLFGRDGRFISPGEFIPMAEESGMIDAISWIVLEKVCEFLGANPELPLKTVSVNMTGQQILDPSFIERIEQNLEKYQVEGKRLRIEITERTITDDFDEVKKVMEKLAKKDIHFYLDDFGTGYSNLASMLSLPFEVIKFDQSLVKNMDESERTLKTIGLLADIMHENEYCIVAEGIENEQQARAAKNKNLDRIQGYYYAKPLPGEEVTKFLAQFQKEKREATR